jgi:hypothetical protein
MPYNFKIDRKYAIIAGILLLMVVLAGGFNLTAMTGALIFIDLIIAAGAIIKGFWVKNYGIVAGGAFCALTTIATTFNSGKPTIGSLIMQIFAGVVGVGAFIIGTSKDLFRG